MFRHYRYFLRAFHLHESVSVVSDIEWKRSFFFFLLHHSHENMQNVTRHGKVFSVLLAESCFLPGAMGDGRLLEETCRWYKKRIFKILSSCTILSGYQGNSEETRDYGGILSIDFSWLQGRNCCKHSNLNKPRLSGINKILNIPGGVKKWLGLFQGLLLDSCSAINHKAIRSLSWVLRVLLFHLHLPSNSSVSWHHTYHLSLREHIVCSVSYRLFSQRFFSNRKKWFFAGSFCD